ncbi:MAG: hypothetical protein PHG95_02235 [Patescibacteria group bacterium]|nr:hypothetical protein [Patescibacteria group bacterium]
MPGENKIEQAPINTPEQSLESGNFENSQEKVLLRPVEKKNDKLRPDLSVKAPVAPVSTKISSGDAHSQQLQAIENIMSSGLDQVFLQMNPQEQKRFKEEGEKTANKISLLLDKAKVGVDKIISLIKRWLGLIPHTNKFFLEQEAKIKADNILKIKRNL